MATEYAVTRRSAVASTVLTTVPRLSLGWARPGSEKSASKGLSLLQTREGQPGGSGRYWGRAGGVLGGPPSPAQPRKLTLRVPFAITRNFLRQTDCRNGLAAQKKT